MNPRRVLIALTLALLASGGSTWLIARRLTTPSESTKTAEVQYAAASHALQAGEVLNQANTELVAWPASIPIEGVSPRTADIAGREVLFPLAKGQPILDRDLAPAGTSIGLASRIPDGMRAVALRSDEVVGVAGFLLPGSHLDVLVTYRADGSSQPITATVLQNAVVIATGHQTEPDPSGKTSDATVVTLLLTPDEAQRAVLASTQGAIHFVLRNGADNSNTTGAPVRLSQLTMQAQVAVRQPSHSPQAAVLAKPKAPAQHEIETILAGDGSAAPGQHAGAGQ
ncbi:MAG: Flp pilus assembly protein CpaB [Acidobacteriota bacterium]|nr:Flp pilus assembly protein CpaB [Acidobacteriota bacterium]